MAVLIPAARNEVRELLVQEGRLIPAPGPRVLPEPVEPVESSGQSIAEALDELRTDRL